jgi:hypothetical protein
MKQRLMLTLFLSGAACHLSAHGADSLLRISCDEEDVGAEVSLNGKFRGECPIDVKVVPGKYLLRVSKTIDAAQERVFEMELRVGEDTAKRIDAVLKTKLTRAGQAKEDKRLLAERAEAERQDAERQTRERAARQREAERIEAQRSAREQLAQQVTAANAGDNAAQFALGERYRLGRDVPRDIEKAREWYKKAAASGNRIAGVLSYPGSAKTPEQDIDAATAMLALTQAPVRRVQVRGHDNVRAFVQADPFFAAPPNSGSLLSYTGKISDTKFAKACQHNNRLAEVKMTMYTASPVTTEGKTALAGMMHFSNKAAGGALSAAAGEVVEIDSVSGAPFPLTPGNPFTIRYLYRVYGKSGSDLPTTLTCAVTDSKVSVPIWMNAASPQLICLSEMKFLGSDISSVARMVLDEGSGCMIDLSTVQP